MTIHKLTVKGPAVSIMSTYELLSKDEQSVVRKMSDAAREVMRQYDLKPRNDDAAARFDEGCAVYLVASLRPHERSR